MSSIELETRNAKTETDLRELAQDIVHRAINGGATAAECVVREGDEFSTLVRLGQVETLKESGSKAIGVRVFNGKRAASTYSSDFSHNGLDRMLKSAAMQRSYWFSGALCLSGLESPEHVGKVAAERTLRRLGAKKVKTAHVPVVFDPLVATSILEHIFEGVNGDSVYRGASFLAGKLGQKIASENVNVIDDGTMPGGFGTAPFDGEGIPTRRTVVIENGVLKSYVLNTYTARKLGLQTTANASRGLAGTPGIGPGNYFLQPGTKTQQQIIGEIKEGLYVTEFLGHGANLVTGDYSRGASGLWISGGELAFPVEEITVAGNLKEMFLNISEIANDLEFRGAVASPSIRIDGLTVGGE